MPGLEASKWASADQTPASNLIPSAPKKTSPKKRLVESKWAVGTGEADRVEEPPIEHATTPTKPKGTPHKPRRRDSLSERLTLLSQTTYERSPKKDKLDSPQVSPRKDKRASRDRKIRSDKPGLERLTKAKQEEKDAKHQERVNDEREKYRLKKLRSPALEWDKHEELSGDNVEQITSKTADLKLSTEPEKQMTEEERAKLLKDIANLKDEGLDWADDDWEDED